MKDAQERIADALENQIEFRDTVLDVVFKSIVGIAIILGVLLVIMVYGGTVYDFVVYDIMGNEDKKYPVMVSPSNPLDDCYYSNDGQLCYQIKRVADSLEVNEVWYDYTQGTELNYEPYFQDKKCDNDEIRFETLIGDIYCMREVRLYDVGDFNRILERCSHPYYTDWNIQVNMTVLSCKFVYEYETSHFSESVGMEKKE